MESLKASEEDEYVIKKQITVLNESLAMVPDCERRLRKAYEELQNILESEQDLAESKEYLAAKDVLEEAA